MRDWTTNFLFGQKNTSQMEWREKF